MLKADNLNFAYPGTREKALAGVSFSVAAGEVLGLVGPMGAGKTTLCMALAGFAPRLTGGEIEGELEVCGLDPRESSSREMALRLGYVFEDYAAQITQVRVLDEVVAPLLNRGVSPDEAEAKALEMLDRVGLGGIGIERKRTWELSGGQQQRVAIAATLSVDPQAIIFDSATGMLDPEGKEEIRGIISELAGQKTLLVVENDADFLVGLADRMLVLEGGGVVADGLAEEVLRDDRALCRAGVDPPVALRFARALYLEESPLTIEEATGAVARLDIHEDPRNGLRNGQIPEQGFPAVAGETRVKVEDVAYRYPDGTTAIEGVNVTVRGGEVHALIGGNGAGKSTLAKMIIGLLKPTEGETVVDGVDTRHTTATELAWRVGTAFQNPDEQISERTVADELAFPLEARRYERAGLLKKRERYGEEYINSRVEKARGLVGLDEALLEKDPSLLPTGQRRLVTTTESLVLDPDVIVLDEPRVGLDAASRARIERMMQRVRDQGKAVVLIEHDMDLVCEVADTVTILNRGRVALQGPIREVFAKRNWDTLAEMYIQPPKAARLAHGAGIDALTFEELDERLVSNREAG